MPEDLASLLAELKRLDPETYSQINDLCENAFEGHSIKSVLEGTEDDVLILGYIAQGEIQRAIAARFSRLGQYFNKSEKYEAEICIKEPECLAKNWVFGSGDSPAAAILAAYVQALKA